MKLYGKWILILLILGLRSATLRAQDTLHVLFLGNSYTYTNDLPGMFTHLAQSGGRAVVTGMNAPGGYTLQQHCTNSATLNLINLGVWDVIVLQEQSQIPTIPYWRDNSMYPAARYLDSLIGGQNAATCFFLTWGREQGGTQSWGGYYSPPFANFSEMQNALTAAYFAIANELAATTARVGEGWRQAVLWNPAEDLWQEDGSHPTIQGTYLTACVFYATLFQDNPVGLPYTAGLNSHDAQFLQSAAWFGSLSADIPLPHRENSMVFSASPNPFNPSAVLSFELRVASAVTLEVFDVNGRSVGARHAVPVGFGESDLQWYPAGAHQITFDGSNLPSGIYFAKLTTIVASGSETTPTMAIQKLVLLK